MSADKNTAQTVYFTMQSANVAVGMMIIPSCNVYGHFFISIDKQNAIYSK